MLHCVNAQSCGGRRVELGHAKTGSCRLCAHFSCQTQTNRPPQSGHRSATSGSGGNAPFGGNIREIVASTISVVAKAGA
jgi:hypothetical protein